MPPKQIRPAKKGLVIKKNQIKREDFEKQNVQD